MKHPPLSDAFHPLANAWGMLDEAALADLADDIRVNGLREPVVLFEGKVLDGRNRWAAAKMVGVPVRTVDFVGDPVAFVRSMNEQRRHLTVRQRQAALRKLEAIANECNGGDPREMPDAKAAKAWRSPTNVPGHRPFAASAAIAKEAGGSDKTAQRLDQEAIAMLDSGDATTAAEAYEKVATPPSQRQRTRRRPQSKRQGKLTDSGNPAKEAEKLYGRLETILQRCGTDYHGRMLTRNADLISKRIAREIWVESIRDDVKQAALSLMDLLAAIDQAYEASE